MRSLYTILLLFASNIFMTFAWYGHLKFKRLATLSHGSDGFNTHFWGLFKIILISWGIAFFEYLLMVPANRLGSNETGGNFDLVQLKVIQEVISLIVFVFVVLFFFKGESLRWNHFAAFALIVSAVYLVFRY